MCACYGTMLWVLSGRGCLRKPLEWCVCTCVGGDKGHTSRGGSQLVQARLSAAFVLAREIGPGLVLHLNLGLHTGGR